MSKKDYELIARVLRYEQPHEALPIQHSTWAAIVSHFADELQETNPLFDRARFIAACEGRDSTDSAGRKVRYS